MASEYFQHIANQLRAELHYRTEFHRQHRRVTVRQCRANQDAMTRARGTLIEAIGWFIAGLIIMGAIARFATDFR